ncbi:MAG: FkbM family methyltransferase [Phycisphaeraceae bacterium]|nr:FkbM family methyltransferase [Phycisphaeraceae bacterium]
MTTFYSQHGEDIIALQAIGKSRGPRYFVEVGVIDGRRFSNTLALEQQGWRGLCIEAHPRFVDLVRRNRPGSTVIHAAASAPATGSGGTLPFYADPRGDLSSLIARDERELKQRFGGDFRGLERIEVPVRTLDDMLYAADAPRGMEVVSIDVEGAELSVLAGFNLSYWRPRMLIVEADDAMALAKLTYAMCSRGYRPARRVGVNAIFCRNRIDALRVRLARVNRNVLHTANPFDDSPRDLNIVPSAYETRRQYAARWLRHLGKAA